ncbi:MAG: tetratricopeptide repeat protein [Bacteroidota bacterium]
MKTALFTTLSILFSLNIALGQIADIYVDKAERDIASAEYENALKMLDNALNQPFTIKQANIPKAFYLRAKAKHLLVAKANALGNVNSLIEYSDYIYSAYYDLVEGTSYDNGKWIDKINELIHALKPQLLTEGQDAFNQALARNLPAPSKEMLLKQAESRFIAVVEIDDASFRAYDYMGKIAMERQLYSDAKTYFEVAIDNYDPSSKNPDFIAAYMYLQLARLYFTYYVGYEDFNTSTTEEDLNKAYGTIMTGMDFLESEKEKVANQQPPYSGEALSLLEQQYETVKKDLDNLRLDILYKSTHKYELAKEALMMAILTDESTVVLRIALASMVEEKEPDLSIELYKQVLVLDPMNETTNFNLGNAYFKKGTVALNEANNTPNLELSAQLKEEALTWFEKSKPFFVRVIEINPANQGAANVIKQIESIE